MNVYLDCNATAPMEPRVRDLMLRYFDEEYGNAGSRTHEFGLRAKQAVQTAREQVASVVDADASEVIFTSGATESNNLAILGLAKHLETTGKRHIVTTSIEHHAVLEPVAELGRRGFEVTLVPPEETGRVSVEQIMAAVREDTGLISVMQVNNETGVIQPVEKLARSLKGHDAYYHIDAAQGFGKRIGDLLSKRVDLISVSSHKVYGPKGVGALIARRRGFRRPPLKPLMLGGGQERGLRPGTLPVPLIAGLGLAAEIALEEHATRAAYCIEVRDAAIAALSPLNPHYNADPSITIGHVLNVSLPHLDSEAAMVALKGVAAISNGSACTSEKYAPSHVLTAQRLGPDQVSGALRISWSHLTPPFSWEDVASRLRPLLAA